MLRDDRNPAVDSFDPRNEATASHFHQDHISRRAFIKSAAAGAVGLNLLAGASIATARQTPVASPVPIQPPETLSATSVETWGEPWIWRPSDWPGQALELNVIENENPGFVVGYGNPSAVLFSYGGMTPGPTIRMRGDETLFVRLRNLLGRNDGTTTVGPFPDPKALPSWLDASDVTAKAKEEGLIRYDFCIGEHVNGVHSTRVTNLHTHGLHVRPGRNPDGAHSDNIILRLLDQADLEMREANAGSPYCAWLQNPDQTTYLTDDEVTGFADYEFRLGNVQADLTQRLGLPSQPHPPGTHWYHPHCHGATHNQVASGMAGFLIIEGDVDEAVNLALTGERSPDPQQRTGLYDYIERVMFIQRVFNLSVDPDAPTKELKQGGNAIPLINGDQHPDTITMRPGAIERWRVLNGSVDGQGYIRFMVVKGQYAVDESVRAGNEAIQLVKLTGTTDRTFTPVTAADFESDKQTLYQLAFDGVTLVTGEGENAKYTIKDLSAQNPGTANPIDRSLAGNPNQAMLANLQAVYANAESIRNTYIRPNEVYMAPANRTDLFFQAPALADGSDAEIYTILARGAVIQSDSYQAALQSNYTKPKLTPQPEDVVVGYIVVSNGPDTENQSAQPIPAFDVMTLADVLPDIPEYHRPIDHHEVRVKPAEGDTPADPDSALPGRADKFRSRTIAYSGWGAADFPLITTASNDETASNFRAFVERDQANGGALELLRYAPILDSGDFVLLAPNIRSMAIASSASNEPANLTTDLDELFPIRSSMPRKFNPNDPLRPRMLEGTAEEWALYNYSMALWADTSQSPVGQNGGHYPGQPLLPAEGQAKFAAQPNDAKTWVITSKGVDHPFHIHQNPVWVMRLEVPDENGNLVNILGEPRWQDVVWIPRNGGRAIVRSRFPDYIGVFVDHCHILLHEDNGMMQTLEITPFADQSNYDLADTVASSTESAESTSSLYPRLSPADAWRQNIEFYDSNRTTGQRFPGFLVGDPPSS